MTLVLLDGEVSDAVIDTDDRDPATVAAAIVALLPTEQRPHQ